MFTKIEQSVSIKQILRHSKDLKSYRIHSPATMGFSYASVTEQSTKTSKLNNTLNSVGSTGPALWGSWLKCRGMCQHSRSKCWLKFWLLQSHEVYLSNPALDQYLKNESMHPTVLTDYRTKIIAG